MLKLESGWWNYWVIITPLILAENDVTVMLKAMTLLNPAIRLKTRSLQRAHLSCCCQQDGCKPCHLPLSGICHLVNRDNWNPCEFFLGKIFSKLVHFPTKTSLLLFIESLHWYPDNKEKDDNRIEILLRFFLDGLYRPPNIGTDSFLLAEFDFGDDVLCFRLWELFYKRNDATPGSPRQKQDRFLHFCGVKALGLITFSTIIENIYILLHMH